MDANALEDTLRKLGYAKLNPMQDAAVKAGLLDARNFVASAPTASGKTLLALLKMASNKGRGKAVYIAPLRALAAEKHREFTQALAAFEMSVALTTGDLDSSDEQLAAFDVIVATSEKLDSLLRHKTSWLDRVTLVVADEVHLLNDGHRGATLEIVLAKMRERGVSVMALSATIPNAGEVAAWLNAKLFESGYRPTLLEKKIACEDKLYSEEGAETLEGPAPLESLVGKALSENSRKGQAIIFVSTRRNAEAAARELSETAAAFLTADEREACAKLAAKALKALAQPTEQCKNLAACLRNGTAFHHAGLVEKDRRLIEEGFKHERCIKLIAATTTLAMGIDFPASWVIVRDAKRFDGEYSALLPNLEIQQMLGRAGRPKFDKKGIGVICCSHRDLRKVRDKYILGPLENIYSKLSAEPALRSHTLALVASEYCNSFESLQEFYSKTFFAHQYGSTESLFAIVEKVGMQLCEWGFLAEKDGKLAASPLGRRVSELYIDPLTAQGLVEFVKKPPAASKKTMPQPFPLLLQLSSAIESKPLPHVLRTEEQNLWKEAFNVLGPDELDYDADALGKWKNSKIIQAWIDEKSEVEIMREYDLPPGVLHSRMRIVEWLAYCAAEIAYLLNAGTARLEARKLQRRVKHGVKEELLDLVRLRGIGRARARKLHNAGVRNRDELRAAGKEKLAGILGSKVAERIIANESAAAAFQRPAGN